ncbi:MAG: beta-lactamase family protein [Myxococcales bacterium]|nr:beta-lactamase family protein [Myxococcales bacterium]
MLPLLLHASLALAQDPVDIDVVDLPADLLIPLDPVCPDAAWPGETWDDRTGETMRRRPGVAQALDAYLFPPGQGDDPERRGVRTDGFLVVHGGHLVYERYRDPYGPTTRHLAWSVTKPFVMALAGVAVRDGHLALTDTICDHLRPEFSVPDASCTVTVEHLLGMTSGFDWNEAVRGATARTSSVLAMLYGVGAADMATFAANHPLAKPPGTSKRYSSGDSVVLSAVVGAALREAYGDDFPFPALLAPLGIDDVTWERDAAGTYVGSSHLWATPRDLARFGFLLLQDGCWEGTPLLPDGWVERATSVGDPTRQATARNRGVLGWGLWLNKALPDHGWVEQSWPDLPEDLVVAEGNLGQVVAVLPSHDLVVVRTADDRDESFDLGVAVHLALDLVEDP